MVNHLYYEQNLPLTMEECWDFFSNPANLQKVTPEDMGLGMTYEETCNKIYAGQIIVHQIRPFLNIPIDWVTEITHVDGPHYFVDEQRIGPYRFWHHEHRFIPISNGVQVIDLVYYKLPFGFIGKAIDILKVRRDLEFIFSYRRKKLETLFGPYHTELPQK